MFYLKHVMTGTYYGGTYYGGMNLRQDFRTLIPEGARTWQSRAAAESYGARFGTRYEVVEDCVPHGTVGVSYEAPSADYVPEPGCTCTMLPYPREDALIDRYAKNLRKVYEDRTAEDHTFVDLLAQFLKEYEA